MDTIQKWLQTHQQRLACDFAGIACNVATDDKPKEIRWIYVAGNQSEAYKKIRLQIGRGIAGLVWKTARTQLDENILEQPEKLIDYPIAQAGTVTLLYYDFDLPSRELCLDLIDNHGLLFTPGDCFEFENCVRIGYGCSTEELIAGLNKFSEYLATI